MKTYLLALSLLLIPGTTFAAWGPGGCATVVAPVSEKWVKVQGTEFALYKNGVQIGNYDSHSDVYRALYRDGTWGPVVHGKFGPRERSRTDACKCNSCNCTPCKCEAPKQFFGVDSTKLHKDGVTRHYLNGRQVPRAQALAALELTDDSARPFVTFIGQGREAICKAFLATPESAKCRVNSYDANDWHVTGGFVTGGTPTVYVQNTKGEVLYRGDHPPVEVVQAEARKAQPDYDATKDPSGQPDPLAVFKNLPGYVWVLISVVAVLFIMRRKDS